MADGAGPPSAGRGGERVGLGGGRQRARQSRHVVDLPGSGGGQRVLRRGTDQAKRRVERSRMAVLRASASSTASA
jgi:hypothetical protein